MKGIQRIEFINVDKEYENGFKVLKDVNLTIEDGEFVAIISGSGAGKSTLIRTINKMHEITSGKLNVNGKEVLEKKSRVPAISLALLIALVVALSVTEFSLAMLIRNMNQLWKIIGELLKPNWEYLPSVVGPLIDTIKMSLFGSFLGAFVALPISFLAAQNMIQNSIINWIVKLFFTVVRTLSTLVSALIATYIFGLGTLAGTFAIFLFSFSYVGKIMYEEIETVEMGAYEAMISMGYTKQMAFIKGVLPEILATYISTSLFNFEGNVRYASILGYVGAGGLGLIINENIGWRDYNKVGTILFAVIITVMIIEVTSRTIRKKLS